MSTNRMADVDYDRKFLEMQKYIPFLERVIEKLRNNDHDKPRKAQLEKMQTLHNLLNNKQKKLKIDTLLKCESVLKKLYSKIEKSEEISPPMTLKNAFFSSTLNDQSSDALVKPQPNPFKMQVGSSSSSASSPSHSTSVVPLSTTYVTRSNLIEINPCPSSPVQFGMENFQPPVEIPTERRCSPVRVAEKSHWELQLNATPAAGKHIMKGNPRFQNHLSDYFNENVRYSFPQQNQLQLAPSQHSERTKNYRSRWSDSRDRQPEPLPLPAIESSKPSTFNKAWSSSTQSNTSSNHRSHGHQRNESTKVYSSEEENWDDPEDEEPPPAPKFIQKSQPTLPPPSQSSHRESTNRYQEKNRKHSRDVSPSFPALPDSKHDKDTRKLYNETIFKYKKPDAPTSVSNPLKNSSTSTCKPFMNSPPSSSNPFANAPQPSMQTPPTSNIFNRLGDKVESNKDFKNFRIEVKNDKMKPKSTPKPILTQSSPQTPASPPTAAAIPKAAIDEVLKSPPLSADDIDDLLNESLEAAMATNGKPKLSESGKDDQESALDVVRKKLAMISKPLCPESPPPEKSKDDVEPFYRRGHTPTKKSTEPDPVPLEKPNPIDPVIERLALKYNPRKRRDSMAHPSMPNEIQSTQSPPFRESTSNDAVTPEHRLALKYNPHPRRDSTVSPLRLADPRVGKMVGQVSPLVTSPHVVSPVSNVLPSINPYDPRLRNARIDPMPFCTPIPFTAPLPSLLDLNLNIHIPVGPQAHPPYGVPTPRLDPRIQKHSAHNYNDKFNPERNDQTERMKYLESKKKKPPEPKTYGEYKQSKNRQRAADVPAKVPAIEPDSIPVIPLVPTAPSTLDKMYRDADYGKELGKGIQGFKIPKKPKPEEPKLDPKKDDSVALKPLNPIKSDEKNDSKLETETPGKKETLTKKPEEAADKKETLDKKPEEAKGKKNTLAKKPEEAREKRESVSKKPEEVTEKKEELLKKHEEATVIDTLSNKHEEATGKKETLVKKPEEPTKKKKPEGKVTTVEKHKSQQSPTETHEDHENKIFNAHTDSSGDESKSETGLVIDEAEDIEEKNDNHSLTRTKRAINKETSASEVKPKEVPPVKAPTVSAVKPDKVKTAEKEVEVEIKPRRIVTRRSTIARERPPKLEKPAIRCGSLSPPRVACRSPSRFFSPNNDNSIVSIQNIIDGKRRTRASINFNETKIKKPATPKTPSVAAAPTTTTPKNRGKAKPAAKKTSTPVTTTRTRQQTGGKQTSGDGQICAVSSTTSQGGDADDTTTENSVEVVDVEASEEPTSSVAKPQTPAVDADENDKKQEWLEEFLKSIVDPSTNKDRILDMLKAVLDEKKLQQVKDILYSPEDEDRESPITVKKQPEKSKPRAPRTKKNELDRLNEDIRDMFICQGVVTATGRRMCTLAKDTAATTTKPTVKPKETPKEKKKTDEVITSPTNKRRMRKAKVIISPLNLRALRSRQKVDVAPIPKMPVLEPNTPIKLPEEGDDDEDVLQVEITKKKPEQKTKGIPSFNMESDDDEDDIQLVHLKRKIIGEAKQEEKENEKVIETVKKVEKRKLSEKKEDAVPKKKAKLEEKVDAQPKKIPRNTNPDWHSMSEYANCCLICNEKSRYIAPHYQTAHSDSEVYTSRLPPTALEDLKRNVGNRALYAISRNNKEAYHYRCPFCDFQATNTLRCWLDHFSIHTGEYQYKCSSCFKAMNSHLNDHIRKSCPDAKKIAREPMNLRGHSISGFVCHLCNYVQMLRSGVVRHLKMHHDVEDEESLARIIEVKLIDSVKVPIMDEVNEPPPHQVVAIQEVELAPPPAPPTPPAPPVTQAIEPIEKPKASNMEVFLSRELVSPTSDVLTERLKSIDQDDGLPPDLCVNTVSPFKDGQAPMTIAEKWSQRLKNIGKQNVIDSLQRAKTPDPPALREEESVNIDANTISIPMEIEAALPCDPGADNSEPLDDSLNESGKLVIDEQEADGTDSEWADNNDEDDNWEDIEITETKGTTNQKDKKNSKSIYRSLSRFYASIAPKKNSKKAPKDKEKKKPDTKPSAAPSMPDQQTVVTAPKQISNLTDLLPDSASDSLDMLLGDNFSCLEGDGNNFPHLDLNDLDSPIFLLPEEQTNLQDAMELADNIDSIKYDVLGNPLPPPQKQVSSGAAATATSVNRIENVGFSIAGNSVKYYCKVTACTFLFSDHPDGLQNHFLMEHPALRWSGYCHTCQSQICPAGGREMQHMIDKHSMPKPAVKPRIKFRRLTGDILSTGNQQPSSLPAPPAVQQAIHALAELTTKPDFCLSTMLQREPKAMIQPQPPPKFQNDIPLYKNVSKEFQITAVAEGVSDDDLHKLVLNQANSTPGGIQISQVISLNAGGKSVSPAPQMNPRLENHNSPIVFPGSVSNSNSPVPFQSVNVPCQSRSSPVQTANPCPTKPTYKCGATQCQFFTNHRSAMNEHILHHFRTDNDHGSLKCHECAFAGSNIPDYFQHISQGHSLSKATMQPNDLTLKIQDILRATATPKPTDEETDPLEIPVVCENTFAEKLRKVAEEMVANTGIPESEVWKCPYPGCTAPITEKEFPLHVSKHTYKSPGVSLKCPHCPASYLRAGVLKGHMKGHSRHQFFCYLCCATLPTYQQSSKHFGEHHYNYVQIQSHPLIPGEPADKKPTFFLINSEKLSFTEVNQFGENLLDEWERKRSLRKTHYKPQEYGMVPLKQILVNEVYCTACNYKTKVRNNMLRHLELHIREKIVADLDPINPVPCLEKKEKHFDKMTNLAGSSAHFGAGAGTKIKESTVKIPVYVPDMRRFVCGHPGCTYLTITDQMLRSHLNALHSSDKGYQCPHCQEEISKKSMCSERVVQHLKFHGPKIYQCGECEYLHYTKHVVERHINEKHGALPLVNLIAYDRTGKEVNKTTQSIGKGVTNVNTSTEAASSDAGAIVAAPATNKFKWECAICKLQTVTVSQMISHASTIHKMKHQYSCVHCAFGSTHLVNIMEHIETKHPSKTREANYVFYKINDIPQDKALRNGPIWWRNNPQRGMSIRGILKENEIDVERRQQSEAEVHVDPEDVEEDDDDDDVEIVNVIESETTMKPSVLGCFHCNYTVEDITLLNNHWRMKHWDVNHNEPVPTLPFFFRIHSVLKCPTCSFIGDHVSLQLHAFNTHGRRTFCAADPKLPNTCGHCPFVYPTKRLEVLTRHYHNEHHPADVKNLSTSLLNSVLALGKCQAYMQCYYCTEIFADQTLIFEHQKERHSNSIFRCKHIQGDVIYRCGLCQYSSPTEKATLRHMIDHFGGFMRCNFCLQDQENFNAYMQHCYTSHLNELKRFKQIYTRAEVTAFLGQMLLIFPNGLIVNKRNLIHTKYGITDQIRGIYDEICKKALEPPIPPLSMGQLMAKKLTEAKESSLLLPPLPAPVTAKRIGKRRITVATSGSDHCLSEFPLSCGPQKIKKRKTSISEERPVNQLPLFKPITSRGSRGEDSRPLERKNPPTEECTVGMSFYGKRPEPVDLSKIYTHIAIGDKYAPVSVKKFALLFKVNAKVVVEKSDFAKYRLPKNTKYCKPCPASRKKRFI